MLQPVSARTSANRGLQTWPPSVSSTSWKQSRSISGSAVADAPGEEHRGRRAQHEDGRADADGIPCAQRFQGARGFLLVLGGGGADLPSGEHAAPGRGSTK
ncbi:MAG: hypothetical protein QM805_05340 [Pseudomonas sp.]